MTKEEQIILGVRELYSKMVFLNNAKMKDRFEGYQSSEIHCLEAIGRSADSNVTKLAESFYMTRGAISKINKKLLQKGLIESDQRQDNKKEIYFRLTAQGKAIYNVHEELHKGFQERDQAVFEQITGEEFDSMLRFMETYSKHLDAEIKKQGLDLNN